MATWTWYAEDDETYWVSGNQYERRDSDLQQGTNPNEEDDDDANLRGVIMFNYSDIRRRLAGKRIEKCVVDFYVRDTYGSTATIHFGTHNYTSLPFTLSSSRLNSRRASRTVAVGTVLNMDLGTQIGAELRDGVATGLCIGPAPTDESRYWVAIARAGDPTESRRPRLTITYEDANQAPNIPALIEPTSGAVRDTVNVDTVFRWQHSDPNADPQRAFRFQRRQVLGTNSYGSVQYWTGSGWSTTVTERLVSTLADGGLRIPAGQFPRDQVWEWTVSTQDTANLWGAPAAWRRLYTSVPPTVNVTQPIRATPRVRVDTVRPVIRWTFADADGDPQFGWSAQIVEPAVYNAPNYDPNLYLGNVWQASGEGTATSATPNVDLRNHRIYRAYVRVGSSPNPSGGIQYSEQNNTNTSSYVEFEVAVPPGAPTVVFPANGSVADLAGGFTLEWRNNFFGGVGSQVGFKIRRQVQGTAGYQYWNGSAWVATEPPTFLQGASTSYSFRTDDVPNGPQYVFFVRTIDDYNEVSPWSGGAQVLGSSAAQVNIIAPTETTNVTNPTVTWTMFDRENDPQQSYRIKVIHSSVYPADAGAAFDPTNAIAVWDSGEQVEETTRNFQIPVDLENDEDYRVYVQVTTNGVKSGWAQQQFRVSIVPPALATAVANVTEGAIDIIIQGRDSMLDLDESRCFGGWESWNRGAGDTSNSLVDNAVSFGSSQSGYAARVRATVEGATFAARTNEIYPVQAGMRYTAGVNILANLDEEPLLAYVSVEFLAADGTLVAVASDDPESDESAIRSVASGIAPINATHAGIRVTWRGRPASEGVAAAPAVNDAHIFFDPVLRPTTGGEWSPGGTLRNTFASVTEVDENRQVRYGQNVPIPVETQRVVIRDEEARMGVPMRYAVTIRAKYGEQSLVTSPLVLNPVRWVDGWVWISDPLRLDSGRYFGPQSFDAVSRPVRQGKFRPIGRPDAIMTTGVRGLREGSFTIVAHTKRERQEFQALSDMSEIILLRIPPDQGELEGETLYVRFEGDAPEVRPLAQRTPHRTIQQSWTEQRSPTTGFEYQAPDTVD
jgi:hypothetical protein